MRGYLYGLGRGKNALLTALVSIYLLVNSVNIFLDGSLTWAAYSLSVVLLVFLPALIHRDTTALPPFEILLYLAVPFTLKGIETGYIATHTLGYLAAAGVALLIVTELHTYTSFSVPPRFAVWLVSLTTIATAGFWAVGRWLAHLQFGTPFVTEHELMLEFVAASIAGAAAGKIFGLHLRRRDRRLRDHEA